MAGAANLARTEADFRGSIYPLLEAIEEQVTLLRLLSEMEVETGRRRGAASGARTSGFGLGEASVVDERVLVAGWHAWRASACSARPAWTIRTTSPRSGLSRDTSRACSATDARALDEIRETQEHCG